LAGDLPRLRGAAAGVPHKKLIEAARALIGGTRDVRTEDAALAAFGLQRDAPPDDEHIDVWPEHWQAVETFGALMTQWSMGMHGPTGLRYESVPVVMRIRGVPRAEWAEVFEGIRVMEAEALRYFADKRNG